MTKVARLFRDWDVQTGDWKNKLGLDVCPLLRGSAQAGGRAEGE